MTKPFVPRRGRPSRDQQNAIEHVILETARRLFFEEGFDPVSMDSVASIAGVSKGTLYARYGSKSDLFIAVSKMCIAEWVVLGADRELGLPKDPVARLRAHVRESALALARPDVRAFQKLMLGIGDKFPDIAAEIHQHGYLFSINLLATDLEKNERAHGRDPKDMRDLAEIVIGALVGWQLQRGLVETITTRALVQFADRLVDIVAGGRADW